MENGKSVTKNYIEIDVFRCNSKSLAFWKKYFQSIYFFLEKFKNEINGGRDREKNIEYKKKENSRR